MANFNTMQRKIAVDVILTISPMTYDGCITTLSKKAREVVIQPSF